MKLRLPIVTLAALLLVTAAAALAGCSKDKGTNPIPTPTPESFNSGDLAMGVPFTHTFNTAGTYAYRCVHHSISLTSGMVGTVIVDDNSANMGASVNVATSSFTPASVTIQTGSTVTWSLVNGTHTVTRP
jgi:plastocyanin